jgi:AAA+ ATPase superfamily predicted ATPase
VAIDEFQYLRFAKQGLPEVFHRMRAKWQFHNNVTYVVSGSEVWMLQAMVGDRREPFYFFYVMGVMPFERETSVSFLEEGFKIGGVKVVNKGDVERLVDFIDCFPA